MIFFLPCAKLAVLHDYLMNGPKKKKKKGFGGDMGKPAKSICPLTMIICAGHTTFQKVWRWEKMFKTFLNISLGQ